jgi:non-ribosomal peptide synthetase component E (peptide arylation enzyme)
MSFATLLTPERIARETAAGHWRDKVITDFLDEHAAATPDKVAFVDSRRQVTFA